MHLSFLSGVSSVLLPPLVCLSSVQCNLVFSPTTHTLFSSHSLDRTGHWWWVWTMFSLNESVPTLWGVDFIKYSILDCKGHCWSPNQSGFQTTDGHQRVIVYDKLRFDWLTWWGETWRWSHLTHSLTFSPSLPPRSLNHLVSPPVHLEKNLIFFKETQLSACLALCVLSVEHWHIEQIITFLPIEHF